MKENDSADGMTPSQLIDKQIAEFPDWRGKMLEHLRRLIHEASPDIIEEWKWGTAVFSQNGMVCSTTAFKDHVKLTFFKGASLTDPKGLINAGQDAKAMRSIDFKEGDVLKESDLKDLIREAVANNIAGSKKK